MQHTIDFSVLYSILNQFRTFLFSAGIILVVVGIIVGGIVRATAFGNEKQIALSNMALSAAVVGLLIIVLAIPITNSIENAFPATNQLNCTGAPAGAGTTVQQQNGNNGAVAGAAPNGDTNCTNR